MSREFDTEILLEKNSLDRCIARLGDIQQEFIRATAAFLQDWYGATARDVAGKESDVTNVLGSARLAELKKLTKGLQDQTSSVVNETLENDNLWWHRDQREQHYFFTSNQRPQILDEALSLAGGRLVPLLREFGYLKQSDFHRHYSVDGVPKYSIGEWPREMRKPIENYEKIRGEAQQIAQKLKRLEREKAESEARGMWDQV